MKTLMKEYMLTKWAEAGLTTEDLQRELPKFDLTKVAEQQLEKSADPVSSSYNMMMKTLPLYALGIPAASTFLLYGLTHPYQLKKKLRGEQRNLLQKHIKRHSPAPYEKEESE